MSSSDVQGAPQKGAADAYALAFNTARQATGRGAVERYKKAENVDPENVDAVRAATERFRTLPLLLAPELHALALTAATEARGARVEGSTRFPATIWMGGAAKTRDGRDFLGTFSDMVNLLKERATKLAPKREGWVVTPTSNRDGHRTNASTTAMHALNLDCDGNGTLDLLTAALRGLDYAFIAYQTGGWTPTTPKWHILIPLSKPFDTSTPELIVLWKSIYNHARVVFGALGQLLSDGFDPTVETPSIPVFITERRADTDPPRVVTWQPGHSLDLMGLMLALPPVEETELPARMQTRPMVATKIEDDRLEEIITALCVPMSKITNTRRDLYLALAGALCDRGTAEDAVAIVEEVSNRCPGDQDRHSEHVHNARTTVGKWESEGTYTRIGTLNDRWPTVATALDAVLPNPFDAGIVTTMREMLDQPTVEVEEDDIVTATEEMTAEPSDRKTLHKVVVKLRRKKINKAKKAAKEQDGQKQRKNAIDGMLLNQLLEGEVFNVPDHDRASSIKRIAGMLAFKLPRLTPLGEIRQFFHNSVNAMLAEGEKPDAMLKLAEDSYLLALKKRIDQVDARNAQMIASDEQGR